ncbi:unnamed protein product [Owenia fusiformis]|uniref:Uncharacterized protein n=1 Tax=Owenia fusiformis TaxID=6347 RepID=A0A8S4PPS9_OWEFU|nr:unnamed protein product [Owenia fusiformis]
MLQNLDSEMARFFIITMATVCSLGTATTKNVHILPGGCDFYEEVEARFPCGEEGYVNAIGKKICDDMHKKVMKVQPTREYKELKLWFDKTRICLQTEMSKKIKSGETDCDAIKNNGESHHVKCIVEPERKGKSSVCNLSPGNVDVILDTVLPIINATSLKSLDSISIITKCWIKEPAKMVGMVHQQIRLLDTTIGKLGIGCLILVESIIVLTVLLCCKKICCWRRTPDLISPIYIKKSN